MDDLKLELEKTNKQLKFLEMKLSLLMSHVKCLDDKNMTVLEKWESKKVKKEQA